MAAQCSRQLTAILGQGQDVRLSLVDRDMEITLPMSAIHLLAQILDQMAQSNSVLTTQQPMDFREQQKKALEALAAQAQELEMGY